MERAALRAARVLHRSSVWVSVAGEVVLFKRGKFHTNNGDVWTLLASI
jgi:hypothetical protein